MAVDIDGTHHGTPGVLIVDDAPELRLLLRMNLLAEGFRVVGEAGDGMEAVRLAADARPDVVLLDIAMPVMDGLEAIPEIRTAAPGVRIVVLSGFSADRMADEALRCGADAFLEKSASEGELVTTIRSLCPDLAYHRSEHTGLAAEAPPPSDTHELRLRSVLDALEEGVVVLDATGFVQSANFAAARILRLPTSELSGRPWEALVPRFRPDGEPVAAHELPVMQALRSGRPVSAAVHEIVRPDGEHRWLLVNARPLMQPGESTPHGAVVTFMDMTEQHDAQLAVERSEHRLRGALENMLDAVTILEAVRDSDGQIADFRVAYTNGAARTTGRFGDVGDGHPLLRSSPLQQAYAWVVDTGEPLHLTASRYFDVVDGREVSGLLDVHAARLDDGVIVAWRDVSDRERVHRELARRQAAADREHDIAETLQRSLLPVALPDIAGATVAAAYRAAGTGGKVGGDWFDVLRLPAGAFVVVGDVEGHDSEAAALMGLIRSAVRAYALEGHPPAMVLQRANTFLEDLAVGRTVTVLLGQLFAPEGIVTMASAGHPAPLLVRGGSARPVGVPSGGPLGARADASWRESTFLLTADDTLLLYTDGLAEAEGGPQPVLETMPAAATLPLDDLVRVLVDHSPVAPGSDDTAVIAVRLSATGPGTDGRAVSRRLPASPASVSVARWFVADLLRQWTVDRAAAETAELLVSELMTSAARHSDEDLELRIAVAKRLRVEVADSSHRLAGTRAAEVDDAAGRGLHLVDTLATDWGIASTDPGTVVWFELDLD